MEKFPHSPLESKKFFRHEAARRNQNMTGKKRGRKETRDHGGRREFRFVPGSEGKREVCPVVHSLTLLRPGKKPEYGVPRDGTGIAVRGKEVNVIAEMLEGS